MIVVMALIGAVTRLTEAGLSITSWDPVTGALPPWTDAAWDRAFAAYRQIPQYQVLHQGMTLDAFKQIYFWEWLHRFWGRLIGMVFALPFVGFLWRGMIGRERAVRLAVIFALGGLQGFVGWFMVQSGLEVRTSVSPYRLAMHLGLALLLYALLLWTALGGRGEQAVSVSPGVRRHGWAALALLAVTMLWGAFVAGLHAGAAYNTWPLMDGEVVPASALTLRPTWINAFENLALVQFMHRWLGPATMLMVLAWAARLWRTQRPWATALGGMAVFQVLLGMITLLTHVQIVIATLHQAGAIALLTLMLINLRKLYGTTTRHK
jgi:cytochrome c oxidase assembly protein subunit 15